MIGRSINMKKLLFALLLILSLYPHAFAAEVNIEADNQFENTLISDTKTYGIRIIRGSATNLHSVYFLNTGGIPQIRYARSTDNGATWPTLVTVRSALNVMGPAFQIGNNFAFVAFAENVAPNRHIWFSSADVSVGAPIFSAAVDITPQLILQGYTDQQDVRSLNLFRDPGNGNLPT
jgi:hypothetical protein